MHARAKRVEDACDAHLDSILVRVSIAKRLCNALGLVVACTRADGVDVAPVGLRLRVHLMMYEKKKKKTQICKNKRC